MFPGNEFAGLVCIVGWIRERVEGFHALFQRPLAESAAGTARIVISGFGGIAVRNTRSQLPDDKFLKDIGGGSCANADGRVFKG
jgi:hypothetical protein